MKNSLAIFPYLPYNLQLMCLISAENSLRVNVFFWVYWLSDPKKQASEWCSKTRKKLLK